MSWVRFDIKSFLKESRHWKEDKERLQQEMDARLTLPSVENSSGVRSTEVSDITARTALRRLEIQAEIEDILLNEEILAYAIKRLTEDERALFNGFYRPKKKIGVFVEEYGKQHGLCRDYVYDAREAMLDKMRILIEGEYYDKE